MLDIISYKDINESLYKYTHASGVKVYIIPKKGFSKSCAHFTTHYGSIDNEFMPAGKNTFEQVPDGIAHFLEHKMFEQETGENVFDRFAQKGASANAYTSFDITSYHFWSTSYFEDNLKTLIEFVQAPYFTDENVAKEQGIIGQEINMYKDEPNWRVYFNMLDCLYKNHPIKRDIAGTIESIGKITKETLYSCYNTFYNPSNMVLCAVGDFDPEAIAKVIDESLKPLEPQEPVKRIYAQEPLEIAKPYVETSLSVARPIFCIGYKDKAGIDGNTLMRSNIVTKLALSMLLGKSSKLYNKLYQDGLIDDSFGFDHTDEATYSFSEISGESHNPQAVAEQVQKAVASIQLNSQDFERIKRSEFGSYLRMFNSTTSLSDRLSRTGAKGIDLFESRDIFKTITLDEVAARIAEHLKPENMVVSIVTPN